MPKSLIDSARELAILAGEMAPEHGRASYGEPVSGLTPSDIYKEDHATSSLEKAKKALVLANKVLAELGVSN